MKHARMAPSMILGAVILEVEKNGISVKITGLTTLLIFAADQNR